MWNGSGEEGRELQAALERHCTCVYGEGGNRTETCAAHNAVMTDQVLVDHLVFYRRQRDKLIREEFE